MWFRVLYYLFLVYCFFFSLNLWFYGGFFMIIDGGGKNLIGFIDGFI